MKKITNPSFLFFLFCCLSFIGFLQFGCKEAGPKWAGSIHSENGVTVVKNPVEPYYSSEVLTMEEELSIGSMEGPPEYMFQQLRTLVVNDQEEIFALDIKASHVKVFDQKGEYLRTIGKPGQGPGELQLPITICLNSRGEIIVGQISKISLFTPEGEFIKSIPQTFQGFVEDIDPGDNYFVTILDFEQQVYKVQKFDQELKPLHIFGESPLPSVEIRRTGKRRVYFPVIRFDVLSTGQVVCGYADEGYILKIYDDSGKLIKRIEKEYLPVPVTQEDKDIAREEYPERLRDSLFFPDEFPPFIRFKVDDEDLIYVSTYERPPDGDGYYHDVFDQEGKFITRIVLKARPLVIKKNKLYTIEENEDGYQFIKRYRMIWNLPRGKN